MKRILVLLTIMAAGLFISCEAGDDEAPASGNGTVEVQVKYTGAYISKAPAPGDGQVLVILLNDVEIADTRPPQTNTPAYYAGTVSAVTDNSTHTVTINNIPEGNYYVLLVYNSLNHGTKIAGNGEAYAFYETTSTVTSCNADANYITVTSDHTTTLTGVSFSDTYKLQATDSVGTSTGGSFIECPTK